MLQRLRQFMNGRYGFDQLSRLLFIVSIVFWILSAIFRFTPLRRLQFIFWILNVALYAFAVYRILSKDIARRTLENDRYLALRSRLYPKWDDFKKKKLNREFIYKTCPNCSTRLRFRRIRGKHTAKCPKCGEKFKVRVYWE